MKEMKMNEFMKLVSDGVWERSQDIEIVETLSQCRDISNAEDEYEQIEVPHTWGVATLKSECNGLALSYTEGFNFDVNMPHTFSSGTAGQSTVWELHTTGLDDIQVLDDDGDVVPPHELADYLDDSFSTIDYSELDLTETTDVDVDKDSDMDTFTLEIDHAPDIRFTGELIASESSSDNNAAGSSYSGKTGRWTELFLYKTQGGKYICHQIGRTCWDGERDRYSGKVCDSTNEVIEFFGQGWLAKALYFEAKIENVLEVE